ncbi:MAG: ATP synthase F1 subunit epsilon [Oscillospiraceae bacterium]|nr:ATP synthase F1 subunit epsilon [Oscillospiraceae bacterium]
MATFKLQIVTPDRVVFDGEATYLLCRTASGDVGILANHTPYTAPLKVGMMKVEITSKDDVRYAALNGGILRVGENSATIITPACEWQDEIDTDRAERAAERARAMLQSNASAREMDEAEVRLKRALNRLNVAGMK